MAIEAVILAGGLSKRMGTNKSLVTLNHKSLISHVVDRINPQVNKVWINTNEILSEYSKDIQFTDVMCERIGPLGGIYSSLDTVTSEWIQFCSNDCPFIPNDLVEKLYSSKYSNKINILVPKIRNKHEPTFILCHRSAIETIPIYIKRKNYKLMHWIEKHDYQDVEFYDPHAFVNINDKVTLKNYQNE